jgi:tetratricopeptide (TPR) repeat protein
VGFRMSKSIKIMPGVKMNISKSGVGYSVGGKGYRVTKRADGRVTRTVSLPGTSWSHTRSLSGGRSGPARVNSAGGAASGRAHTLPAPPAPPKPPKPGLLSPSWEKDLFAVLESGHTIGAAAVARKHGRTEPLIRVLAATLDGLWHYQHEGEGGDAERARGLLAWAVANGADRAGHHPFAAKYLSGRSFPVEIANGITAYLELSEQAAPLALAELHQAAGDLTAAIAVVEAVEPTGPAALSLAELYSDAGRHQDVVDLTGGLTNQDDATALLLVLRGRAFSQLGYQDAAREALKEALRVKARPPAVRHRALLERASVNLAVNRKAAARKDVETVLSEDPEYPGLTEALLALPA